MEKGKEGGVSGNVVIGLCARGNSWTRWERQIERLFPQKQEKICISPEQIHLRNWQSHFQWKWCAKLGTLENKQSSIAMCRAIDLRRMICNFRAYQTFDNIDDVYNMGWGEMTKQICWRNRYLYRSWIIQEYSTRLLQEERINYILHLI